MIPMRIILFLILIFVHTPFIAKSQSQKENFEVVIVGATPSGIAAAINAAKYGHSVALVEEYAEVGGLMSGGLSFTDFISYEALGGFFKDYMQRVVQYYSDKYGPESQQVVDCHDGIHAEPHVTLAIFQQMLEEYPNIRVFLNHRLEKVFLGKPAHNVKKIAGVQLMNKNSQAQLELTGKIFIDATYEGDLAAYAGADYRIGRESRQEYGEPLAGKLFFDKGRILVGSTGEADNKVQGYNFRLIMTDDPDNRRLIDKPDNYNREDYLPIAEVLKEGKVSQVFVEKSRDGIFRTQMLPNRKADVNDIKNAPVRVALLGENYDYPDGDWKTRQAIIKQHKDHILGMLYFIQNDEAVPPKYRKEARQWGLAKDEFTDNDNFPTRLYIREARRIMGKYVFTQNDVNTIENSLIVKLKKDAIAIGDYALNCHGVGPSSLHPAVAQGDFNFIPPPFQIPFGVIIPNGFSNMLVSVAVSASHVGFCGIRLEPTWVALGQAAGLTAHLALKNEKTVPSIEVESVQNLLYQNKAKTTYIADIDIGSEYFEAAQYLGVRGFLHDVYLMDTLKMPGVQTYRSIRGTQYAYAYPFHELNPQQPIEQELAKKWISRIKDEEIKNQIHEFVKGKEVTRGEVLTEIYRLMN